MRVVVRVFDVPANAAHVATSVKGWYVPPRDLQPLQSRALVQDATPKWSIGRVLPNGSGDVLAVNVVPLVIVVQRNARLRRLEHREAHADARLERVVTCQEVEFVG